jgi:hypothetical protein
MVQFLHRDFFSVAYSIWVRRVASAYLLSEPTIFLGKCLSNKGNNNGTVLQGAFKRGSPQKQTKPIRSSTI